MNQTSEQHRHFLFPQPRDGYCGAFSLFKYSNWLLTDTLSTAVQKREEITGRVAREEQPSDTLDNSTNYRFVQRTSVHNVRNSLSGLEGL
jgi:hypothetical protein